jgi:type VI protein secretion system component Hcp
MFSRTNRPTRRTTLNVESLEDRLALSTLPTNPTFLPLQPPPGYNQASSIFLQFSKLQGQQNHLSRKMPIESFTLGSFEGNTVAPITIDIPLSQGKLADHLTAGTQVGKVVITVVPANGNNNFKFTLQGTSVSSIHPDQTGPGIATETVTLAASRIHELKVAKDGHSGSSSLIPPAAAWNRVLPLGFNP